MGVVSKLLLLVTSNALSLVRIVVAERLSLRLIRLPAGNLPILSIDAAGLKSQIFEIVELIYKYFFSLHNSILLLLLVVLKLTKTLNQALLRLLLLLSFFFIIVGQTNLLNDLLNQLNHVDIEALTNSSQLGKNALLEDLLFLD